MSRATPRTYQQDPPHGSSPQGTGREPFGWQSNRSSGEYRGAQPPSLGSSQYTQEVVPFRQVIHIIPQTRVIYFAIIVSISMILSYLKITNIIGCVSRPQDPRTLAHQQGSMPVQQIYSQRQPDRVNPYQDPRTNEILSGRPDHRRRTSKDLTAGTEDELSETRLDDRRGDGARRRTYSQRDVVDLTTGIGGLGLNETPGRQPANHGQRDRPDRRERESERRGRADSVSNRQVLS